MHFDIYHVSFGSNFLEKYSSTLIAMILITYCILLFCRCVISTLKLSFKTVTIIDCSCNSDFSAKMTLRYWNVPKYLFHWSIFIWRSFKKKGCDKVRYFRGAEGTMRNFPLYALDKWDFRNIEFLMCVPGSYPSRENWKENCKVKSPSPPFPVFPKVNPSLSLMEGLKNLGLCQMRWLNVVVNCLRNLILLTENANR